MKTTNTQKPKYEIIMDDILSKIKNNDFSYDTVLCTEKQLSEQYQVSRITAKRAITDLEQRGILYRRRGVGSFVARNALNNLDNLSHPVADSKMASFLLPFDITKGGLFDTVKTINMALNEHDYFMNIYITDASSAKEKANLKLLLSQHPSGLIYYPMRDRINLNLLNEFVFQGIPVVIIDKTTDCSYLHNVVSDNFEGGRLLTEHLIRLGHRRIGFLCSVPIEETSSVRNRFGGYLHQLQSAGISPGSCTFNYTNCELTDDDTVTDEGSPLQIIIRQMYQAGITAILAENDRVARLIMLTCNKMGLRIPEDLSVCGFDNNEIAREMDLTTVGQDFHAIGEEAARILITALSSPAAPAQKVTIPVKLFVRSSTGSPGTN